jgi:3-phenylpropionate/trans-cinnamate dioxygenase ferredoxin reductase subunit
VAIGASPAVEWLAGSAVPIGGPTPAEGGGGVLCEPGGRASQGVYAAGDVAAWWDPSAQIYRRVEHRLNATEQGRAVARSILAVETDEPPAMPYFWSDQYDLRLQSYGLPEPGDEFVVVEGSLAERRFVGVYLRGGAVSGVLGSGLHRQLRGWRARIGEQFTPAAVPAP